MSSRIPSHKLSSGLYVSGRPEQPKEKTPTMSSVAMPYTGGDIKKSGELGKMFDIPVDGSKSKKSGPITGGTSRSGSFGGVASHSGPIMPNATARTMYTTSGSLHSQGISGSASLKKSNSGPLSKHGEPVKKLSGPQSGGVTPTGRQHSGPLPPVLPTTGLITSGPISSGPLNSSGAPRKVSGPLESMGSMKSQGSVAHNHAVTTLTDDDNYSFTKNFPRIVLWSLILLFVMGFIAGGFILGAVHNAILLIVVVVLFGTVSALFIWNTYWGRRAIIGFIARYPDSELRTAKNGQFVKVSGQEEEGSSSKGGGGGVRILSASYADLEAPRLTWNQMSTSPVPRLDGAAIQINNLLYVFAGYGTIDYVHSHVDIYNFTDNTWGGRFDMPKEMAHSHLGMATDGRFIYVVNGQYGPQCRGPTPHTFVLDTHSNQWHDMPPLPVSRYAPATQLWRGRLHVMGGSKENRHTPALEHWSLAVKDGKALEKKWRTEIPIPRGGPHRACVVVDDRLYVIGGQEGDFMAKPGSPIFKCSRRNEVVYSDVYMLDDDMKWKVLPSMPKPDSHIEFAWVVVNNSIVIVGGTTDKHPQTKKMILNGEVFQFNLDLQKWSVIGKLPFRVKTTLVGYWNGWLYFTSGQRDKGPDDPSPKKVIGEMWRTKLKLIL